MPCENLTFVPTNEHAKSWFNLHLISGKFWVCKQHVYVIYNLWKTGYAPLTNTLWDYPFQSRLYEFYLSTKKLRNFGRIQFFTNSSSILRDFKNAPFCILCLFHMIDLRMFSLSFFILLQNGPWFAMISICSCCSFWRNIDVSVFQQLSSDKCKFDSIWKQTLLCGSRMS